MLKKSSRHFSFLEMHLHFRLLIVINDVNESWNSVEFVT